MTIPYDAWLLTRALEAGVVTGFTSFTLLMLAVIHISEACFEKSLFILRTGLQYLWRLQLYFVVAADDDII